MAKAKKEKVSPKTALKKQTPVNLKAKGKSPAQKTPVKSAKASPAPTLAKAAANKAPAKAAPVKVGKTAAAKAEPVKGAKPVLGKAPAKLADAKTSEAKPVSKTKVMEKAELQAVLTKKAEQALGKKGKVDAAPAPVKAAPATAGEKVAPSKDLKVEKASKAAAPVEVLSKKQKAAAQKALEAQEDLSNAGKKWLGLYNQLRNTRTKPYDMSASYDVKSGIQHKTLGWGYVVETRGDRMDVLFKDGMKTLVINYVKA